MPVPVPLLRAALAVLRRVCLRVRRLGGRRHGAPTELEVLELDALVHTGGQVVALVGGERPDGAKLREVLATFDPTFMFGSEDALLAIYDASVERARRQGEPADRDVASVPLAAGMVRQALAAVDRALGEVGRAAADADGPARVATSADEALRRLRQLEGALAGPARDRARVGVLGARDGDRASLARLFDALGCDGDLVVPDAVATPAAGPARHDVFVALHAEAAHAATGGPLPASAPVVCVFRATDGFGSENADGIDLADVLVPPASPLAPVLPTVVGDDLADVRPVLEDALALAAYVTDHPDDAEPVGRHFRPDDALDVLCVGDDPDVVELIGRVFQFRSGPGGTFRGFARVADALAAFAERPPDVLWTNQSMPEMDGDELLQRLRPRTRHVIPTVLDSGGMERPWRVFSPAVGAGAFVAQPFGIWTLDVAFRNAARMRRAFLHAAAGRRPPGESQGPPGPLAPRPLTP